MGFIKKHPALVSGLTLTLLFLGFWFVGVEFLDTLELKYYDVRMKFRGDYDARSEIVIVDIDNDSIEKLGRWPWSRSLVARGVTKINEGNPKVIGLNLILSEREENSGLKELQSLETLFTETVMAVAGSKGEAFLMAMYDAEKRLDNDSRLKAAIEKSGKVMLPAFFKESIIITEDIPEEDERLAGETIQNVNIQAGVNYPPRAGEITLPIPEFQKASLGVGHINCGADIDGTVRKERIIYEYNGLYVPSYPLRLASAYLNIPVKKIRADLGESVTLGSLEIPLTRYSQFLISFKGKRGAFKRYSFYDVINDKVPASIFKNKIVLVSPSASGIMNPLITPADISMPMGEFSANTIWAILNRNFISEPAWAFLAELLLILTIGVLITFVFPKIKAMVAGLSFFALMILLMAGATYLFVSNGLWIQVTYPILLLVAGYIGVISIRYFVTEVGKEKIEGESAETNRMLGVSFQEQGMLDMAFDKFRRVPVDDQMMDILYNLAQDFERKRQLNKAASVYEYMAEHDDGFKDIKNRHKKLVKASDTMVFGDGFLGGGASDKAIDTDMDTRPTLGRYEIIKQLGKGAMGIVYLGKDPTINRTTAIKTVRFADDFEPEEAKKMSETFFREAESAGTLSHPNIVTIYDAGREQDIAYIAMEFLEGTDLEEYTKPENLLPMRKVIDYVADIADGLDYAHQKGIVHRDIKPANIMLLKTGEVKITDFGIARISATSQTMTGVIKGTPHYMSPEQFSGKKVDGRSDIFSLGTMLFRLLTGHLPFYGDNPASLMHMILNEPPPDPRTYNPKIVKPLVLIINKALEKDRDKRYRRGGDMARNLRDLGKKIDAVMASRKNSN